MFPYGVRRVLSPIGSVNFSAPLSTSNGQRIAFHTPIADNIPIEANAGFVSGSIIFVAIPYSVAPSILAASRRSLGRPDRYCLKKNMVDAEQSPVIITPTYESISPIAIISL